MTSRVQDNQLKAVFFFILFTILILHSVISNGQHKRTGPGAASCFSNIVSGGQNENAEALPVIRIISNPRR
jgi:hypothetical protein